MIGICTTLQKYSRFFSSIVTIIVTLAIFTSCGLFDKDIKQDQHIARYRHQLGRIHDSLDTHKARIMAYDAIISDISSDNALITPRKKNNLLVEGFICVSDEYVRGKNLDKAMQYADTVTSLTPESPIGYYSKGCIYQIKGEDSLAVVYYDKAIKLSPNYADAYYNRGIIHEQQEKLDEALSDYNRAVKLNPSYLSDIYINRGNVYFSKEMFEDAIADYSKVIEKDTTSIKAYRNRAEAYVRQDDLEKALMDYDRAILLDSMNVSLYVKRASVYELNREYEEALDDYKKVIKLDPQNKLDAKESAQAEIKKLRPLIVKNKRKD